MRTLILYATKSGAAGECAGLLAKQIEGCTVCNLSRSIPKTEEYDTIIIGSGVRMGKIYKPAKKFIEQNVNLLLSKKVGLYLCNAYPDTLPKVIEKNIPGDLVKHAVCLQSFGGKPPFNSPKTQDWVRGEELEKFVGVINDMQKM